MTTTKAKRQDYFPNYMSWRITQAPNPDDFTTDKIFTPIPRSQVLSGNRAIVMELLKLEVVISNLALNADNEFVYWSLATGGVPTDPDSIQKGSTFAFGRKEMCMLTSGSSIDTQPYVYNMQSQDGFGLLLATDAFHCSVNSNTTGANLIFDFRLFYRFVQIPVTEYIGIVQSQQTS